MILLIDNYDSFTYNLARYFEELGREVRVVRSDTLEPREALDLDASAYVISPGPGGPSEAGISVELVRRAGPHVPVLGVCLGLQCIGVAYGGTIVRSGPVHGKVVDVRHEGTDLFTSLPSPLQATRYHSLALDAARLPEELQPLAWTLDGQLMAARHRERPVWGVQFHPEALLTEYGHALLNNFLALAEGRVPPGPDPALPGPETDPVPRSGDSANQREGGSNGLAAAASTPTRRR